MEKINIDKLSEMSGERFSKPPRITYPYLKFNGNTGLFTKLSRNQDGSLKAIAVKEPVKGVILRIRRRLQFKNKDTSLYSNEHDSPREELALFERKKGTGTKTIGTGNNQAMREKYPDLKVQKILYMMVGKEVLRFPIKTTALKSLFDYFTKFKSDEHLFEYETEIVKHQETGPAGNSYWVLDFKKLDKIDVNKGVASKIQEIANAIEESDSLYKEVAKSAAEKESTEDDETPED